MKFSGKTSIWFWGLYILSLSGLICSLCVDVIISNLSERIYLWILLILVINVAFLPIILRNYIILDGNKLSLSFGFIQESIEIAEIRAVKQTCNSKAATAASLDRLVIISAQKPMIVSIQEKERFFTEIKKLNPQITIS